MPVGIICTLEEKELQYRQTRIEVDISKIAGNVRTLCRAMGDVSLLAVVKANAYGHGQLRVSETALKAGAKWLGVAIAEEGEYLRENGITAPILVLGGVNERGAGASVKHHLTQTVFDVNGVKQLSEAGKKLGLRPQVHIKLDTGMGRIGVCSKEALAEVLEAIRQAGNIDITGAFTHFANADATNDDYTEKQLERFKVFSTMLPSGIIRHAAASAALLRYPQTRFDMVRTGIVMYGYAPVEAKISVEPALSWKTEIVYIKTVPAGECISYGCTYQTTKPTMVATLPVGYGDGYHRALSGKAEVLVGGVRCPVLGRVCMDQMMVDVSAVPNVRIGEEAVLLGRQGNETIDAEQLAVWANTIPYEILLAASARVPIIYVQNDCLGSNAQMRRSDK